MKRMMVVVTAALTVVLARTSLGDEGLPGKMNMYGAPLPPLGQTWTEIDGQVYGAQPDERGPIGGGRGYRAGVTRGDHQASNLDTLLEALGEVKAGEVVFIPGDVMIDCTTRVHIEKLVLKVPAGVTLAGDRGHNGSEGAMITSDAFATDPLVEAVGPGVRVTGLRLRGPDPHRRLDHHRRSFGEMGGHDYYYKFPLSVGIRSAHPNLEVDNCELAGWSHGAIYLVDGEGHHLHHNYIHHCQYTGMGYGVVLNRAFVLVERNLFNHNRHSIAGTGRTPSGYEAAHNVEIGVSLSHMFDMHGGRDRRDGTNIAGTRMSFHHNTFRCPKTAIVIRGRPEEPVEINHNWFIHPSPQKAVHPSDAPDHIRIRNNAYDLQQPEIRDRR